MSIKEYLSLEQLVEQLSEYKCIHIEGNHETAETVVRILQQQFPECNIGYLTQTDKGYERETIYSYLKFFHSLHQCSIPLENILEQFQLTALGQSKLHRLRESEILLVQYARLSTQQAALLFIEEPLLNLNESDLKKVVAWLEERCQQGLRIITINASLKLSLLLPGSSFYPDEGRYLELLRDQEPAPEAAQELTVLKIPARSERGTLLFDPKDIDYIESINKSNYLSVRGDMYQLQQTMDELEETLKKSGFFRCHRSYIVNVQRVERLEQWTRNSYVLLLNNSDHSKIPLAKGRIQEMKATYNW